MAYRLTRQADEDVIRLYLNGITEFGEAATQKFLAGLFRVFDFLGDYPLAARERREITPPVRAHPYKSHLVIYIVEDGDVSILGIRHGREDWMSDPPTGA